ncbi:putative noc2p family protein [Lyophyllum shimeji]|uniref:Noc2p family protein n=1 Tax=Lyophyllum shimeji TaxID=47721 RepID=A0A9P3UR26_LYOSH|nr:putative noc2p family protein [Lyophyllum shimeji]
MGKKASKATKKFVSSGQLKKAIQARHKHQQIRKKTQGRRGGKDKRERAEHADIEENEEEINEPVPVKEKKSKKKMSVDELLDAGFMDQSDDGEDGEEDAEDMAGEQSDEEEDEDDFDDAASFASVDDLEEDGERHLMELSKLADKDPEFYKYLQENDKELLNFDPDDVGGMDSDEEDEGAERGEDVDMEDDKTPTLTMAHLRKWQKALLEQRSLRALRRLLIAFRAAAHLNEDDQVLAWNIDSSAVYNKLVTTALRYTPVVLEHHIPYKTLANGKFKPPTQTPKFKTLQKLVLSYFNNVIHILSQITDNDLLQLAVTESAKLIPYIVSSRKAVKLYLKKCLDLWSSAEDSVRIAAFLAIRKLASGTDESIMDNVLKGTYLTLIRSSKSTSVHTLPSINLMKNSASEVFCVDHSTAYQHAFGYIRQLAIHLRNSMKVKTKEAYKQVYNWQYVHCVDFWSIVLARACDSRTQAENGGKESDLKPLIYPLVQVCLGAVKLISTSRSYPFHLHIIRSLLHLTKHSDTFVPLSPYLLPILTSTLAPSGRPKPSTLRPLDLEVHIRAPQQYVKTRVYYEGILEEASYVLAEWLATPTVQGSIAFPEIVVPIVVMLRKALKNARGGSFGKDQGLVKVLLERIEESAQWIEQRRKNVSFAPGKLGAVEEWESHLKNKVEESPLAKYVRIQKKAREKRRKLVEKARDGEDEILDE